MKQTWREQLWLTDTETSAVQDTKVQQIWRNVCRAKTKIHLSLTKLTWVSYIFMSVMYHKSLRTLRTKMKHFFRTWPAGTRPRLEVTIESAPDAVMLWSKSVSGPTIFLFVWSTFNPFPWKYNDLKLCGRKTWFDSLLISYTGSHLCHMVQWFT